MTTKQPNEFRVRLSRTSSAQAILKKERKKSILKVDDIIDDDRSTDTVKGRLPTEAAYVIMKRVTAEVGQPLNPAGISTYNKLQSLKTTPAVELLQQKTWREFFSKKTAAHMSMASNPKHTSTCNEFPLQTGLLSSTEDLHKRQNEMKSHLVQMFDRLVDRVEQLWTALKIPTADRVFYRKSLCKGPPQSLEQCREIAAYVAALKAHQEATVAVIQAIQMREMAIAKCFDVLAALQRKFSRNNQREMALAGSTNGSSALRNAHASRPEFESSGSSFWKEELIVALDDVRTCSLEVIKRIQMWRRNLWRPHPFVYMGTNYVAKMKDDLSILESDIYTKLLSLVPLKFSDLQCIVFFSNAGKILVDTAGATSRPQSASHSSSHHHSNYPAPSNGSSNNSNGDIYIQQLLQEFLRKVNPKELHLAATIVLEEEVLQNALAIEHASLLSKGVFIPTLHTQPGGQSGGEKMKVVARGTSGQSSSHVQSHEAHPEHQHQQHQHQHHESSRNSVAHQEYETQKYDGEHSANGSLVSHHSEMQQREPFSGKSRQPAPDTDHNIENDQKPQKNEDEPVDWAPDFA
uniref:Uncharacterized protein n=1 Tax=Spumella elongata TaxID=89044 RepID=A0A7S3HKJ8_9STRA|mmetsp:Transcript_57029/g.100101  ORF Transcript_57029/g.100101 Transcript_57029/m.100101 type:complete len:576 (+) Transcript_57029:24-1751(+)